MFEKNYIKKTFFEIGYPKIISFLIGFVSFPLMINSIGLTEYGVYIYLSTIVILIEAFMDFGITSAWGKHCASLRTNEYDIKNSYFIWIFFQVFSAVLILLISLTIVFFNDIDNESIFIYILFTLFFGVFHNFQKSTLHSLLCFKIVARIDLLESVFRTLIYLMIAFFFKSVVIMALLFLLSSILLLIISSSISIRIIFEKKKLRKRKNEFKMILNKSFMFLWLRLSTRLFHELPVIILRNYTNDFLVGLLGSIRKLIEYLTIPFSIIGNILMVRSKELIIRKKNNILLNSLNMVIYFVLLFLPLIMLFEDILLISFFDSFNLDIPLFLLIVFYLISNIVFSLYAPVSDYLGALTQRNYFLSAMVILSVIVLFLISTLETDQILMIAIIVLLNFILAFGYYIISKKIILKDNFKKILKSEILLIIQVFLTFCFFILEYLSVAHIHFKIIYFTFLVIYLINFKLFDSLIFYYLKKFKEI
tara:strand:+ start:2168 stop:3601 length:1434 start_codon:yes stop_codon:yes gene_type:complete